MAMTTTTAGSSWTSLSYVDDSSHGGNDLQVVDIPFVASNSVPPFDTFVTYEDQAHNAVWLHKIWFDSSMTLQSGVWTQVPGASPIDSQQRPNFAFLQSCGGDEIIIVITHRSTVKPQPPGFGGRCGDGIININPPPPSAAKWSLYMSAYDVTTGNWIISDQLADNEGDIPTCLTSVGTKDSSPDIHIAADPNGERYWVSHIGPTAKGTRVKVDSWHLRCSARDAGGGMPSLEQEGTWSPPDPDGGTVSDEWMPAVAFAGDGVTAPKTTGVVWYDTRDDGSNSVADVYMASQTGGGVFSPSSIVSIAFKTTPSDVVPWVASVPFDSGTPTFTNADLTGATLTWDYQQLGAWFSEAKFLAAWGGDARFFPMNGNNSVVMSDLLQ